MRSCIYVGLVRHRRFTPRMHAFNYRLFQMFLDLDELPEVFERRWLWSSERPNVARFCRKDHYGDANQPLSTAIRELVLRETGKSVDGPVCLLTHLRYFGISFNPVSFYYCYAADGVTVQAIVAEVNNTPWAEQHMYVLDARQDITDKSGFVFEQDKRFHVSPFMPMDMRYHWRVSVPGDTLRVHLENHKAGERVFDATLMLEKQPITSGNLARMLVAFPLMTVKVLIGIYYEALRLWLKKVPIHDKPMNTATAEVVKK